MPGKTLAIMGTGLVTPVGLTASASCCAFRAKMTNPLETRFIDSAGAWIIAHQVDVGPGRSGLSKLCTMACWAIEEALQFLDRRDWQHLPLLLCVAEADRPGRLVGLDDMLLPQIQDELGTRFAAGSALVPHGRVAVAVALAQARGLVNAGQVPGVLIVGVDSLISWPTLSHYEREDRLLTEANSDGFMPGEAAGALWIGANSTETRQAPQLLCTGIGFGRERATIQGGGPFRADGLTQAIMACLDDAGRQLHEFDFRITDNSGESFYFKESSLALTRSMRQSKEAFDLWHPAECTGECGAATGVTVIAESVDACGKGYAPGNRLLAHWANDAGQRAAVTLEFGVVA
jgi:3-oxoacyl-[acyl-carrier-protein] synthase-1